MIGILVVLVIGIAATGWFIDSGPGFGGLGALVAVIAIVVLISRNHRDGPVTGTGPATVPAGPPPAPAEPGAYGQTQGTAYAAAPPATPPPPTTTYPVYVPAPPRTVRRPRMSPSRSATGGAGASPGRRSKDTSTTARSPLPAGAPTSHASTTSPSA